MHSTYRITLRDNSQWALDLTSAQYGYTNPLTPWKSYEKKRISEIREVHPFGTQSAQFLQDVSSGGNSLMKDEFGKALWYHQRQIARVMEEGILEGFKCLNSEFY